MRSDVASAVVTGPADDLELLATAADDLKSAGRIGDLRFDSSNGPPTLSVAVTL
jgi:hypothetical protein